MAYWEVMILLMRKERTDWNYWSDTLKEDAFSKSLYRQYFSESGAALAIPPPGWPLSF